MVEFNEILNSISYRNSSISRNSAPKRSHTAKEMKALDLALTLRLLQTTEFFYFLHMAKTPLIVDYDSKDNFWIQLSKAIYGFMCQGLEYLCKHVVLPKTLAVPLLQLQADSLKENCEKLMHGIFFMVHLTKLCTRFDCTFLRHFDQKNQPQFHLDGHQCVGVVFDWGRQLWMNPPTEAATPSTKFSLYLEFIAKLTDGEFPPEFLAYETFFGETCLNEHTASFQTDRNLLLDATGTEELRFYKLHGKTLVNAALQLFEREGLRNPPLSKGLSHANRNPSQLAPRVTVLAATLAYKDLQHHMTGFAKITFEDTTTVYRFIDSGVGEFEAKCPKQFGEWLQQYFQLYGYDKKFFRGFGLQNIDRALATLAKASLVSDLTDAANVIKLVRQTLKPPLRQSLKPSLKQSLGEPQKQSLRQPLRSLLTRQLSRATYMRLQRKTLAAHVSHDSLAPHNASHVANAAHDTLAARAAHTLDRATETPSPTSTLTSMDAITSMMPIVISYKKHRQKKGEVASVTEKKFVNAI